MPRDIDYITQCVVRENKERGRKEGWRVKEKKEGLGRKQGRDR